MIRTDRLEISPLEPGHATEMVEVLADPVLYAFTGGDPPDLSDLDARYRTWAAGSPRASEKWLNWVVRIGAGGPAIGHLQATVVDDGQAADIAWLIGTEWQDRGYASEAARALVSWLEDRGVVDITAHIHEDHVASGWVAASAGLAPTAEIQGGEVVWRLSRWSAPGILGRMTEDAPCSCGCPNTFSNKDADADMERYLKRGPDRTTRALIDAIVAEGVEGATLLDIGSGIGAIPLELLASGAARATTVDASEAYLAVARAEAERRGYGERTSNRAGTFEEIAPDIEPADIVTLDRVVCCDPNLEGLLASAAERARRMVGLVYPRGTWWNRLAARVMNTFAWLTRDQTRWHLHQPADIDRILTGAGFRRREIDRTFVWQVALYVRP